MQSLSSQETLHLTPLLQRTPVKKETITIGTIELDEIFQSLRNACHPTGNCETNDIILKGQLIGEGTTTTVDNVELTLSPHGSYRESHRSSLLDLMESAVRQVAKCEEYSHKTPCPNPMVFCPCKLHRSMYSLPLTLSYIYIYCICIKLERWCQVN